MNFGLTELSDYQRAVEKEWLVTNGLGGFASSTVGGINARKYHGLLFAALQPPVERILLLAKLEEEVTVDGRIYHLGANLTAGGLHPQGNRYLQHFSLESLPTFTYAIENILIEKTVFMIYGQNTTVIRYNVHSGDGREVKIRITPMVNYRDYHNITRSNDWPFHQEAAGNGVIIEAFPGAAKLHLGGEGVVYHPGQGYWYYGMYYPIETGRGENPWEDHFMPGDFRVDIVGQGNFSIVASTQPVGQVDTAKLQQQEEARLARLVEEAGYQDEFLRRLVMAADQFIVERNSTGTKTVIAGYPWFTDWGRDTMIALPGLTLVTGRFDTAREILTTFAKYCKDGLIPNRFPDAGEEPAYNTVDASLWFFQAVYKFLQYTGDYDFIREKIYPVLKDIVRWHLKGTHFDIRVDHDGLIRAGNRETQLTWMDAKVDGWVVTPREGKPVEINALWYNGLKVMEELAGRFGEEREYYRELAERAKESFRRQYWNEAEGCLYDVVGEEKDGSVRPNQIIAVSLPFTMLDNEQEIRVVNKAWKELYTPYGLRSLSPRDPKYIGVYRGDRFQRDGAYHQGTPWSWLMGPFVTAYCKVNDYSPASRRVAGLMLRAFEGHLREQGLGSIAEIFEGNHPHGARGCIAQAWGVAEVLRAYVEDVTGESPYAANSL
ncbi:MAG: amylo-alpha-1,6-glucosidase [Desulfitobacterium hafniense]|nr:amylo-alpha-1,6-glucosidase [Desulfitobacterium hafniense]